MSDVLERPSALPVHRTRARPAPEPLWDVVLLDDDDHTYEYVVEMLGAVFGHAAEKAWIMACEVDAAGRVIVDTTSRERAELKQELVHAYGADWRINRCRGSMSVEIERRDG
jgi:ATP-dependent Clp protease adaptor protein ClpS